jgi:hypothetical protein
MATYLTDEEVEKALASIDSPMDEENLDNVEDTGGSIDDETSINDEPSNVESNVDEDNQDDNTQDEEGRDVVILNDNEDDLEANEEEDFEDNEETLEDEEEIDDNSEEPEEDVGSEMDSEEDEETDEESEDNDSVNELNNNQKQIDIEEYKRLKEFYTKVTGEFKANGKIVKGADDPDKLIQLQQMAYGYAKKMQKFNEYKPFLKALDETGLLSDEQKFNLILDAAKGKPEALKKLVEINGKSIEDIDFDEVDSEEYKPDNHLPGEIELAVEELFEQAEQHGVKDKIAEELNKVWDEKSVNDLLSNPVARSELVAHVESGAYDEVMKRVEQKSLFDTYGTYRNLPLIDRYRLAAEELKQELLAQQELLQQQQEVEPKTSKPQFSEEEIQREIERIKAEKKYKQKSAIKKKQLETKKKKVASTTKRKVVRKPKVQVFDPLQMSDSEVDKILNLIN